MSELLFASFMLKTKTSSEFMILNRGGWIAGMSQGFFEFFQDTLGYKMLSLNDMKQANIVLFSSIILKNIAKQELLQGTAIQQSAIDQHVN